MHQEHFNSLHLHLALEGGEIAAWELNPATGSLAWTDRLFEWMGLDKDFVPLSEEVFYNRVHPEDLPRIKGDIADSLKTGRPFETEFRLVVPGMGTRWLLGKGMTVLDSGGRPIRVLGVNFDITRLKTLEQREKESFADRASIRTAGEMIQAMPDPALLLDAALTVVSANAMAERMFNLPLSRSIGRSLADLAPHFISESDLETARSWLKSISQGVIPQFRPLTILIAGGQSIVVMIGAGYLPPEPCDRPRMIVLTLKDITELLAARNEALENQARLRSLATRLAASEEESRWRISRQIHDTVIQTLSLVRIRLATLAEHAKVHGDEQYAELDDIQNWVGAAVTECRQLMAGLTPPLLYDLGFVPALRDLADKFRSLHSVPVMVEEKNPVDIADRSMRGLLFHATRELVMNAVKHAGASRIHIRVESAGGGIRISVVDDGRGFDPDHIEASVERQAGFGLFSIRERLDGFGGRLQVISIIGRGTEATITLPAHSRRRTPDA